MKHHVFGKKLSRTKNERRILFRNLVRELVDHGSIVTTLTKAQAIRPMVEKLVTKAKKQTDSSIREIFSVLTNDIIVKKLTEEAGVRFGSRNSGYTRMTKIGRRRGDGAIKVMLSFVDEKPVVGSVVVQDKKDQNAKSNPKQAKAINKKKVKKSKKKS